MSLFDIPWVEAAIAVALLGALVIGWVRDPFRAYRLGLGFTGTVFCCAILAWLTFYVRTAPVFTGQPPDLPAPLPPPPAWSVQPYLFGEQLLGIDELNAPLIPAVSLLHFLTALATPRAKMRRFSFTWSLAAEALRLAIFSCTVPRALICLLIVGTVPAFVELLNRGRPRRVYALHMGLFVTLMVLGYWLNRVAEPGTFLAGLGALVLMLGVLVRCGTVPAHCWIIDWFEHASFGIALLYVAPLTGVYAAVRLVLPVAPDWVLQALALVSLITAVYAAGMALVQREARRFFAYLFLSHASLVLVGLELHTELSLTGALCLWFSVILSLGGFGLTLRALEVRYGRQSLTEYHGLYEHSPSLAVCFLLTGLASVGFPGTLGFVSTEVLVDGAVVVNLWVGLAVIAAGALNGIAVLRAYLLLFTGTRHQTTVSLRLGVRERIAVLTLSALVLAGGIFPQPGVYTRKQASDAILKGRGESHPTPGGHGQETAQTGK